MAHLLSFCCLKGYFDHDCLYAVISGQDYRHTGNRLKSITCIRKKGGKIMFSKVKKRKGSPFRQNHFKRFSVAVLSVLKLLVQEFDVLQLLCVVS